MCGGNDHGVVTSVLVNTEENGSTTRLPTILLRPGNTSLGLTSDDSTESLSSNRSPAYSFCTYARNTLQAPAAPSGSRPSLVVRQIFSAVRNLRAQKQLHQLEKEEAIVWYASSDRNKIVQQRLSATEQENKVKGVHVSVEITEERKENWRKEREKPSSAPGSDNGEALAVKSQDEQRLCLNYEGLHVARETIVVNTALQERSDRQSHSSLAHVVEGSPSRPQIPRKTIGMSQSPRSRLGVKQLARPTFSPESEGEIVTVQQGMITVA